MVEVAGHVLIGRGPELQRLEDALARAREGVSATVVVGGEAGVGKSRLAAAFLERCRAAGCRVLVGRCLELGDRGLPYGAFVEALRGLFRDVGPAAVPSLLGPGRAELSRLLPELAAHAGEAAPADEASGLAQARLFELLLGVLERLAQAGPVVVLIEDIHWADQSTRDLLSFLVRVLRRAPVLYVVTARSDEIHVRHPLLGYLAELERLDHVERIEVGRFDREEVALQIRAISGHEPTDEQLDLIAARTDGNPFFVEQVLAAHAEALGHDVPPRLHDVLLARIARLPDGAQAVLRAASAAGREVDDELLASVLELPHQELDDALREAVGRQVLVPVPRSSDRDRRYTFRHALLREVVEDQLLTGERIRLHAAFAAALSGRASEPSAWPDPPSPAELAYHWDAARDYTHALPVTVEAGDAAASVYAFHDALRLYERALALWPKVPDASALLPDGRASLCRRAAEAAVLCGGYARAVELGRAALESLPLGTEPAMTATYHERLRWYLFEAGDRTAAEEALADAERLVPTEPPSAARAQILVHRAGIDLFAGRYARSKVLAEAAIGIAEAVGVQAPRIMATGILGWDVAMLGDLDAGIGRLREALGAVEGTARPEGIALGYSSLATLLGLVDRPEEAAAVAREGFASVRHMGVVRTYGGLLLGAEAGALFDLGRWDEAEQVMLDGPQRPTISRSSVAIHLQHARLDIARGRFDDAVGHLDAGGLGDRHLGGTEHRVGLLAANAELACWQGRTEACLATVMAALVEPPDGPPEPALAWLCAIGVRAAADDAERARARHDAGALAGATRQAHEIAGLLADLISRAAERGPLHVAVRERLVTSSALLTAELGRAMGAADAEAWATVVARIEALGRPYPSAYARYREGAAILASRGPRPAAEAALRMAERTVLGLGAEPLRHEVELLARQARLDLARTDLEPGTATGQRDASPAREDASPFIVLGLTARETEVLRLVSGGWSNQQIADELFITRKTASVHVSNILGKLGVKRREEAAAVAHRLGGPAADAPPPPDSEW
jgi:DNA-binding CsgD family transcriptional regulator/tetratricopeptide (TPR) repeat protein